MQAASQQELRETDISIILSVEWCLGILGWDGKEATLRYMEKSGLSLEEIPSKPEAFIGFLRGMFGLGATIIEGEIEGNLRLLEGLPARPSSFMGAVFELRGRKTLK